MGRSDRKSSRRNRADLRSVAVEIVRTLSEAGFLAYFAGGCVRDRLMGLEPTDYDVATDARPDGVTQLFGRTQQVGESFGVMLVSVKGRQVQVATFRTEGVYSDGRHPDTVVFSDAEHDAQRRDFTINGLFEDPLTGEVIDFVGGRADLKAGLIRAVGDPDSRLREDRLRMLRAVRFAARFGFAIDGGTDAAIRAAASDLRGVSRERVGQEVKRMLSHPSRAVAASQLQTLGLDEVVLSEAHLSAAPVRLGRLEDAATYPTALAAWLLDRHEGREADLAACARRWGKALILSNTEQAVFCRSLEVYEALRGDWAGLGVAGQKRLAARNEFKQGLALLHSTDPQASDEVRQRVSVLAESQLAPPPLIDGEDLIGLGLRPGPVFRRVLEAVYDAQLEGVVRDRAAAVGMAKTIAQPVQGDSSSG